MDKQDQEFLVWLSNRLLYKHGYDKNDTIVMKLTRIASKQDEDLITDQELGLILSKYYADFFLEKNTDTTLGYTNEERQKLINDIRSLVEDIKNKNIPTNTIK
jgi:hypothetical protein